MENSKNTHAGANAYVWSRTTKNLDYAYRATFGTKIAYVNGWRLFGFSLRGMVLFDAIKSGICKSVNMFVKTLDIKPNIFTISIRNIPKR